MNFVAEASEKDYNKVSQLFFVGGRVRRVFDQPIFKRVVVAVLFGTTVVFFQNCGVEKPRVEIASYAQPTMSPAVHQNLSSTTTCMQCHEGVRPVLQTPLHRFEHFDARWAAQDCSTCHSNRTDWGLTWQSGQYDHNPQPASCLSCHASEMPKSVVYIGQNTAKPFVHSSGAECVTCHTSTSRYDRLSDWRPAFGQPGGLVGNRTFSVPVIDVSFNSGNQMIRSSAQNRSFKLEIDHGQSDVANVAYCSDCHGTNAAASGNFSGAYFHANMSANPATCVECHQNARPVGAVGTTGNMRHEAVGWSSNAIGSVARGTASLVAADCTSCHANAPSMPPAGRAPALGSHPFSGAVYHGNVAPSSLNSCLDCHAHKRPTGSASFTNATWKGKTNSGGPPFTTFNLANHAPGVDCATCHQAPSVGAAPVSAWSVGDYSHPAGQTTNCLNCHTAAGVTSTNHTGFNSNCASCHTGAKNNFPNPVIADWKVGVTGNNVPAGIVGDYIIPDAITCTKVLGSTPNCVATNPKTIPKGYDHAINTNNVSCQNCHGTGAASSANGKFHSAPVGVSNWRAPSSADLSNCNACHDPSSIPQNNISINQAGITGSQTSVSTGAKPFSGVDHGHALVSGKQCSTCHTAPTQSVGANWTINSGLHAKFTSAQVTTCFACHAKRMPAGSLARANQPSQKGTPATQYFTHASAVAIPSLAAQECSSCHTDPGRSWVTPQKVTFHDNVATTKNCNLCHRAPGGVVTSSTSGISFNHSTVANIGDCVSCHQASVAKVTNRVPTSADWNGGVAAPSTYTIPSHTTAGFTVAGYTGTHSTNPNCASCHGTGNYSVVTDFDHQGLPANQNSCVSCHLGKKAEVSAFIASTAAILMKGTGDTHHPVSIFKGKNTSCVGCHTLARGSTTFTGTNGVVYPTAAQSAYLSVGCGGVKATFACHETNQLIMVVPTSTGTSGRWR